MNKLKYQRLSEYAPELDIDPKQRCLRLYFSGTEYFSSRAYSTCTLGQIAIEMPENLCGIAVSDVKGTVIPNGIIPPGFCGPLKHIELRSLGDSLSVTISTLTPLASIFLLPVPNFHDFQLEVEETTINETMDEPRSGLSLITQDGNRVNESRLNCLIEALEQKKKNEEEKKIVEIEEEILGQIRVVGTSVQKPRQEVVEKILSYIHQGGYYKKPNNQERKYSYEIHQFESNELAQEFVSSLEDNSYFWFYKSIVVEGIGVYYVLAIKITNMGQFD